MPYKNPEDKRAQRLRWREANREKIKADSKAYYEKNRERVAAYKRRWYEENAARVNAVHYEWKRRNPDKVTASNKQDRERHPERYRRHARNYRQNHLLEVRAYQAELMRKKYQDPVMRKKLLAIVTASNEAKRLRLAGRPRSARCEICNKRTKTVFDHDHKTGLFRGWICDRCNLILGSAGDSPALLRRLARYLEKICESQSDVEGEPVQPKLFRIG